MSNKFSFRTLIGLLIHLFCKICNAHIQWYQPPGWNDGLPASIKVYHSNQTWNGIPINSSYCIFDLADPNIELKFKYSPTIAKTLEEWISEETEPVYMISNAAYFDATDVSLGLIIIDGVIEAENPSALSELYENKSLTYFPTRAAFGLYPNLSAEATWIYNIDNNVSEVYSYPKPSSNCFGCFPEPIPNSTFPNGGSLWGVSNAVGSGPVLVKNNVPIDTWEQELINPEIAQERNPRTAICTTDDGRFISFVVDGRSSQSFGLFLNETAELIRSLGCKDGINLDGGGSTAMIVNGYLTNNPSDSTGLRPVPSVIMVVRKTSDSEMKKEEYYFI